MTDNTQVASGTGDSIRDKDRAGVKTQIVGIDVGIGTATEALLSAANPLPVSAAALPLPTGAAQDGADISAPTAMPAGGVGIRGWLSAIWTKLNGSIAVTGTFWQATQPVSLATNTPTIAAGTNQIGTVAPLPAPLAVTVTAAVTTAATLTLPAVAGQFHYITSLTFTKYAGAALTGAAAPVVVTSTNLPGSMAWTFTTAGAIGTSETQTYTFPQPLRSSVVNTATTVVAPSVTSALWRISAVYYTAA